MAVGLSLKSENIELFRKRINDYALKTEQMPFNTLNIDCKLNPVSLNVDLVDSLSYLQPYGAGNPTPLFGLYNMTLSQIIPLSQNKHLKLIFTRNGTSVTAMKFFTTKEEFPYERGDVLDLAVTLDINEYNGTKSVSIIIKDIKPNEIDTEIFCKSQRNYEDFCLGRNLNAEQINDILPSRENFAGVYVYLRNNGGYSLPVETLVHKLKNISIGKLRVILSAMKELSLIEMYEGITTAQISLKEVSQKVDLNSSEIIKKLRGMQL